MNLKSALRRRCSADAPAVLLLLGWVGLQFLLLKGLTALWLAVVSLLQEGIPSEWMEIRRFLLAWQFGLTWLVVPLAAYGICLWLLRKVVWNGQPIRRPALVALLWLAAEIAVLSVGARIRLVASPAWQGGAANGQTGGPVYVVDGAGRLVPVQTIRLDTFREMEDITPEEEALLSETEEESRRRLFGK